jgi:hypothetical protein
VWTFLSSAVANLAMVLFCPVARFWAVESFMCAGLAVG